MIRKLCEKWKGEIMMGVFEIHGNAKRTVHYDVAVIGIDFVASEKTSYGASSKVMEYCENFLCKLEKMGIDPSHFTLQEDTVSDNRYSDDDRVEATRSIRIKIPFKMDTINAIRDILDNEKCDVHFELDFDLSNEDEIKDELLKEALLDSRQKAEMLADSLGMKVIGIESVETYSRNRNYGDMTWMHCEQERCIVSSGVLKRPKSNELKAKEEILSESIEVKWIIE